MLGDDLNQRNANCSEVCPQYRIWGPLWAPIVTEDLDVDDRTMLKFIFDKQCVDAHWVYLQQNKG
jgi:hypothetical protein